jgi:cytochrome b-561
VYTTFLFVWYVAGILIYRAFRFERKKKLKIAHGLIQIIGFVALVVGLQAVFDFHNAKGIANLYSLHSWLGISTVFLFACQVR